MSEKFQDQLQQLRDDFADELPARLRAVRRAFDRIEPQQTAGPEAEKLHQLLHTLTGSAGTLGQQSIGALAGEIADVVAGVLTENEVPKETWERIGRQLNQLEQLGIVDQAESGEQVNEDRRERQQHPVVAVVDDDQGFLRMLSAHLENAGYRVQAYLSTQAFLTSCDQDNPPDVVLMDMDFPDGRTAGAEAIARMRNELSSPPLAVVISVHDDLPSRLAAYRAGACRYIVKPVQPERVCAILDRLTERAENRPYRVLVVDDDERAAQAYMLVLRQAGMDAESLSRPLELLTRLRDYDPDVLLLDVYMPQATGPELAAVLREDEDLTWLPILFLSAETDPTKHAVALAHGGDDFLIKPVRPSYLLAAVKARAWRSRRNRMLWQSQADNAASTRV